MSVMRAQKEEHDRDTEEEFLGRRILRAIIDLLPHVQVIISTTVEVKRHTPDPMEHKIGSEHVANVG